MKPAHVQILFSELRHTLAEPRRASNEIRFEISSAGHEVASCAAWVDNLLLEPAQAVVGLEGVPPWFDESIVRLCVLSYRNRVAADYVRPDMDRVMRTGVAAELPQEATIPVSWVYEFESRADVWHQTRSGPGSVAK
jgi:hypothetical protein